MLLRDLSKLQDKANFASYVLHEQLGNAFMDARLRATLSSRNLGGGASNYYAHNVVTAFGESRD
jgi:hypothetical protein